LLLKVGVDDAVIVGGAVVASFALEQPESTNRVTATAPRLGVRARLCAFARRRRPRGAGRTGGVYMVDGTDDLGWMFRA